MFRRITAYALTTGLLLTPMIAAPAIAAPVKKAARIVLTSPTTVIDAGGSAAFAVTGLPTGPAVVQMLDPASKNWVTRAKVAKHGSAGAASVSGVPQGVISYRVRAGSRSSNTVNIKSYGIYSFSGFTKQHAYANATMLSTQGYLPPYKDLKVPGGAGCEVADLGLQMESPQPTWHATLVVTSGAGVSQVEIAQIPSNTPTAQAPGVPVSGAIDVQINSTTSNNQPFFGWVGLQFHCLADPGIATVS